MWRSDDEKIVDKMATVREFVLIHRDPTIRHVFRLSNCTEFNVIFGFKISQKSLICDCLFWLHSSIHTNLSASPCMCLCSLITWLWHRLLFQAQNHPDARMHKFLLQTGFILCVSPWGCRDCSTGWPTERRILASWLIPHSCRAKQKEETNSPVLCTNLMYHYYFQKLYFYFFYIDYITYLSLIALASVMVSCFVG